MSRSGNKRVCFLISNLNKGGAERVCSILANSWIESGYHVDLVLTYSGPVEIEYQLSPKISISYLSAEKHSRLIWFTGPILKLYRGYFLIKKNRSDVIVSFLTNVNIYAVILGRLTNTPTIISERIDPDRLRIGVGLYIARHVAYRVANQLVLQDAQVVQWYRSRWPRLAITIIENPVDNSLIVNDASDSIPVDLVVKNCPFILMIGRLSDQKNYGLAFRFFKRLIQDEEFADLRMAIIGKGDDKEIRRIQKLMSELQLDNRIILLNGVGNLRDWYQRCFLVMSTSLYEGIPNVILEACSFGKPVIASPSSHWVKTNIPGFGAGIVVPRNEEVCLEQAFRRLWFDAGYRNSCSLGGLRLAARFNSTSVVEKWQVVIEKMTGSAS